ncbi:MAG: hypothetical protein JJU28_21565 [Cyclobacteriaceae bacterium]|nr:hypothetical protein [Cyclobacteriaceae bacterium]
MEVLVGDFDDNFRPLHQARIDTIKIKGNPEAVVDIRNNEKIIVCDILEVDSTRQLRFIYLHPNSLLD